MSRIIKEQDTVNVQGLIRKVLLLSNCYRQLVFDKKNNVIQLAKEEFVTFFSFKYFTIQDHERIIIAAKNGVRFYLHYPTNTDVFTDYFTYFEISIEGFEKYQYAIPVTECEKFTFQELDSEIIGKEGMGQRGDEVEKLKIVIDAINIKIQDFSDQKFCYGIFNKFQSTNNPEVKSHFPQYERFYQLLEETFSRLK